MTNKRFVLLSEKDNVLVCCQKVELGEVYTVEGAEIVASTEIDVGHKVARCDIAKGDKIIKYMVSIGSATQPIVKGEHVHLHNMKSDYIPSHTRQKKND